MDKQIRVFSSNVLSVTPAFRLKGCIDCGKKISHTAKRCRKCHGLLVSKKFNAHRKLTSVQPFGIVEH